MEARSIPCAVLEPRLEALKAHLARSVSGEAKAVHQARVASRRLREVLPVFGPPAGLRRLRRASARVRRVTRALGPVRELDVALELLAEIAQRGPALARAVLPVRSLVAASRARRRSALLASLTRSAVVKTLDTLQAVVDRLARTPDLGDWRAPLRSRVNTRAGALADSIRSVGLLFDPPRLHLVRIAAKKLRYSLELVADARVAPTATLVETLKKSQEQLGRLHDLQVLLVYVRQAEIESSPRREPGLRLLRDVMERECLREHARYLRRRTRVLDACHSALRLAGRAPRQNAQRAASAVQATHAPARPRGRAS